MEKKKGKRVIQTIWIRNLTPGWSEYDVPTENWHRERVPVTCKTTSVGCGGISLGHSSLDGVSLDTCQNNIGPNFKISQLIVVGPFHHAVELCFKVCIPTL